jgi:hypothetical protein
MSGRTHGHKRKRAWVNSTVFDDVASDDSDNDSADADWTTTVCLNCLSVVTICCTCFLCESCLPKSGKKLTHHDDGCVACSGCAWYPCGTCETKYCKHQSKPCARDDCCEWVHSVPGEDGKAVSCEPQCQSCTSGRLFCSGCKVFDCMDCGLRCCHDCLVADDHEDGKEDRPDAFNYPRFRGGKVWKGASFTCRSCSTECQKCKTVLPTRTLMSWLARQEEGYDGCYACTPVRR